MIPLYQFDCVESTQSTALEKLTAGEQPPFAVFAQNQTKGRGRQGRTWHSESGRSFLMTLVWALPADRLAGLSLVVGLSLRRSIHDGPLLIKWPNDLMKGDHKVGGILVETSSQANAAIARIGMGINLQSMTTENFFGIDTDLDLKEVIDNLSDDLKKFENDGFEAFESEFNRYLWKRNDGRVALKIDGRLEDVEVLGVDHKGRLLARGETFFVTDQGEICIENAVS